MLGLSYPFVLQGERARWATPHGCSHNHRPGARATITRQPPLLLNKMPRCPHARICTNTLALLWLRGLYRKHLVVTANTHFRGKLARTANPVSHGKCLFSWQAHLDHKCWFQPQIAILWPGAISWQMACRGAQTVMRQIAFYWQMPVHAAATVVRPPACHGKVAAPPQGQICGKRWPMAISRFEGKNRFYGNIILRANWGARGRGVRVATNIVGQLRALRANWPRVARPV